MGGWVGERLRPVKIIARGGQVLVRDGEIPAGWITVSDTNEDGLMFKVSRNRSGGPAVLEITSNDRKKMAERYQSGQKTKREVFDKGSAYFDGRVDDPAFRAE